MASVPSEFHDLFEKPTVALFATLFRDGSPHLVPVWIDYDPETGHVLVNTTRGSQKERNARRDPRVGVGMVDPDNAYRRLSVTGEVVSLTEDGARTHLDDLARRYTGGEYGRELTGPRVLIEIRPTRVY